VGDELAGTATFLLQPTDATVSATCDRMGRSNQCFWAAASF
jgi:hypothetical protein